MGLMDRDYMNRDTRTRKGTAWSRAMPSGSSRGSQIWRIAAWLLIFAVVFALIKYLPKVQHGSKANPAASLFEKQQPVAFPESGDAVWYMTPTQPPVARLTLAAPPSAGRNFAVRLDDWETRAPVVLIPVRAGETSVTLMPLGRYRMKIASGASWQGSDRLFGAQTNVKEAVHPIEFTRQGNQTNGHRIELEVPYQGNLETKPSGM